MAYGHPTRKLVGQTQVQPAGSTGYVQAMPQQVRTAQQQNDGGMNRSLLRPALPPQGPNIAQRKKEGPLARQGYWGTQYRPPWAGGQPPASPNAQPPATPPAQPNGAGRYAGLPLSGEQIAIEESINSQLAATMRSLGVQRELIPHLVEQYKAHLNQQQAYSHDNINENMIERGMFDSGIRQRDMYDTDQNYANQFQQYMGGVQKDLNTIAAQELSAQQEAARALAEARMKYALDLYQNMPTTINQDPESPDTPTGGGGGGGGGGTMHGGGVSQGGGLSSGARGVSSRKPSRPRGGGRHGQNNGNGNGNNRNGRNGRNRNGRNRRGH